MSAPIVAVEMGTSKIVVLVGEIREDNRITVIGVGESSSSGIRKGEVVSLSNASSALRIAIAKAEENADVSVRSVYLSIVGGHIRSTFNTGTSIIVDPEIGVTGDDIDAVITVAKALNLAQDQTIIHSLSRYFTIDKLQRIITPEGMEGSQLSLQMMILHGNKMCINNTMNVIQDRDIDIQDVVFGGLCSAQAVLTKEQKDSGVVVIDIGGGTTDYIAYNDSLVAAAGSLAVGGDHITNDMVQAFNIPIIRAEEIKKKYGMAIIGDYGSEKKISLKPQVGFSGRTFSHHAMNTVINARVDEILKTVKKRLDENGVMDYIGAGVVLTGGCAKLEGITVLAHDTFGVPCSVGKPNIAGGLSSAIDSPEYVTSYGLMEYAAQTELTLNSGGMWKKIFKRVLGQ